MNLDRVKNKNIIWTLDFCPECDRIKEDLIVKNISFEEKNIEELMNGTTCYPAAIRQLIKQKNNAPVVLLCGTSYDYE
jgi:glutaredoxin